MVTIYDMVNGEFITDPTPATPTPARNAASCHDQGLAMPRLQPVESSGEQATARTLPADLACVSAAAFVAGQPG